MKEIVSLIVVSLICGFWIIIFLRALYKSIAGRKDSDNTHSGRIVSGKIVSSSSKGMGKMSRIQMTVEFPNFSNADVQESFTFKDSKPEMLRYEIGKTVQLTLEEGGKKGPSVKLLGGKTRGSNTLSIIFFLLLMGASYGSFLLYGLILENIGGDWNNVNQLAVYEEFWIMGPAFIFSLILMQFVFRAVKLFTGKNKVSENKKIKMYGLRATARITKVEETNVKINNNPMIRFYYEFEDDFGTTHSGKDQMVMGMLDLAGVKDIKEKEVLYLKDDPSNSRIMEAMKATMMAGCGKAIFLLMTLIFSIVLISMFVSGILG